MKTIKLTNEMAVALYNKDAELRTTLLHEFTDEELGIKHKPLRWEDLGKIRGCYINVQSYIDDSYEAVPTALHNRNIYPSTKDAEKALAHCQLLQLAKHYNKCDQHEIEGECFTASKGSENTISVYYDSNSIIYGSEVKFKNKSDLEKCIEDNRDLWEIYLGVK